MEAVPRQEPTLFPTICSSLRLWPAPRSRPPSIATGACAGDLGARVRARLFPWAPTEVDAWDALRWAAGRTALPAYPRLGPDWGWHCAPLAEWDGTIAKAKWLA